MPELYAVTMFQRGADIFDEMLRTSRREAAPFQRNSIRKFSVTIEVCKSIQSIIVIRVSVRNHAALEIDFQYAAVRPFFLRQIKIGGKKRCMRS